MDIKTDQICKEHDEIQVHRTGTITFGLVLIVFGVLFLIHLFVPALSYMMIFRMWPCILICLGIEVLLSNFIGKQRFVYDKAAVVLLVVMTCFAMFMAGMDMVFTHGGTYIRW